MKIVKNGVSANQCMAVLCTILKWMLPGDIKQTDHYKMPDTTATIVICYPALVWEELMINQNLLPVFVSITNLFHYGVPKLHQTNAQWSQNFRNYHVQ